MLFDCGEGTQRQMMRYGISFALNDIFVTHWHHDHFLGLLGLGVQGGPELRAEDAEGDAQGQEGRAGPAVGVHHGMVLVR